ncbi:hypothetical protein ACQ0QQ_03225 [Lysinibacillus sphaericus]
MRVIHNEYEQQSKNSNKLHMFFTTFLILSVIYLISFAVTAVPGTYAWMTSETSASGTITNATTEDLLAFQSSNIRYGEQCSMQHTLQVKNISTMNTSVIVSLSTGNGHEKVAEQRLKPGQKMIVTPDISAKNCEASELDYRIQAFHRYVDEAYKVPVDTVKLKEKLKPVVKEKAADEPVQPNEVNKAEKPMKEERQEKEETPKEENSEGAESEVPQDPPPASDDDPGQEPAAGEEAEFEEPPSNEEKEADGQVPESSLPAELGSRTDTSTEASSAAQGEKSGDGVLKE